MRQNDYKFLTIKLSTNGTFHHFLTCSYSCLHAPRLYCCGAEPCVFFAGSPVLLHDFQMYYLHQLVQSRLYAEESPLVDCYQCLHTFCLSLQLDCLHTQVGGVGRRDQYNYGKSTTAIYLMCVNCHAIQCCGHFRTVCPYMV